MSTAHSHGLRIRYETVGEGPTVILHHGGGFRLESWDLAGWAQPLATDHRVVTFDARGNGESDKPTDPRDYALDLMVDDVLAVADACGAATFHYLGFSLGAKVGWGIAASAQDRLDSIALIGAEPEANEGFLRSSPSCSGRGWARLQRRCRRCGRCRSGRWTSNAETILEHSWPTFRRCGRTCRRSPSTCTCHRC